MAREPVGSSLIRAVGYDVAASVLEVELHGEGGEKGRVYRYFDVPWSVYLELMEAESKGAFYNEQIKDMFAYEEVEAGSGAG